MEYQVEILIVTHKVVNAFVGNQDIVKMTDTEIIQLMKHYNYSERAINRTLLWINKQ